MRHDNIMHTYASDTLHWTSFSLDKYLSRNLIQSNWFCDRNNILIYATKGEMQHRRMGKLKLWIIQDDENISRVSPLKCHLDKRQKNGQGRPIKTLWRNLCFFSIIFETIIRQISIAWIFNLFLRWSYFWYRTWKNVKDLNWEEEIFFVLLNFNKNPLRR
jgi:hypothetical protein